MTTIAYFEGKLVADKKMINDTAVGRKYHWGEKIVSSTDNTYAIGISGRTTQLTTELVDSVSLHIKLLLSCYKHSMETTVKRNKNVSQYNSPMNKLDQRINDIANEDMVLLVEEIASKFKSDEYGNVVYPDHLFIVTKDFILNMMSEEDSADINSSQGIKLRILPNAPLFEFVMSSAITHKEHPSIKELEESFKKIKGVIDKVYLQKTSDVIFIALGTGGYYYEIAVRNGDDVLGALEYAAHCDAYSGWKDSPSVIDVSKMRSMKYYTKKQIVILYN